MPSASVTRERESWTFWSLTLNETYHNKFPMGKIVQIESVSYTIRSFIIFLSGRCIQILIVAAVIIGIGTLPVTYLMNLMASDCGTYNSYKGGQWIVIVYSWIPCILFALAAVMLAFYMLAFYKIESRNAGEEAS